MLKQYKPKKCKNCKKLFFKDNNQSIERWNNRKFCSRKCNDDFKRGGVEKRPTKKPCLVCGKTMTKLYEESWKRWGQKKFCSRKCVSSGADYRAPSTAFKKGDVPWNFKEEGYGYGAVHNWLSRHYKKTGSCEHCSNKAKTQWANISGKYKRSISDYIELCPSCHTKMDKQNPKKPSL